MYVIDLDTSSFPPFSRCKARGESVRRSLEWKVCPARLRGYARKDGLEVVLLAALFDFTMELASLESYRAPMSQIMR